MFAYKHYSHPSEICYPINWDFDMMLLEIFFYLTKRYNFLMSMEIIINLVGYVINFNKGRRAEGLYGRIDHVLSRFISL